MRHGCKHEAFAILAFEESMKKTHTHFKVVKCGLFINEELPGCMPPQIFYVDVTAVGKCPLCLENCD